MSAALRLPLWCLLLLSLPFPACSAQSYRLSREGMILNRVALRVAHDSVPAMFVIDDTTFSRNPCGHATRFILQRAIRVEYADGTPADTTALVVGRRVSVYVTEHASVLESCPPIADAAKVILH